MVIKCFCRVCWDFTQFKTKFHKSGKIHVTECQECGTYTGHYPMSSAFKENEVEAITQ